MEPNGSSSEVVAILTNECWDYKNLNVLNACIYGYVIFS